MALDVSNHDVFIGLSTGPEVMSALTGSIKKGSVLRLRLMMPDPPKKEKRWVCTPLVES